MSVGEIIKKVNKKTKIVFLANPNNPTGTYLDKKELINLRKKLNKKILLVIDDAYQEFMIDKKYSSGLEIFKKTERTKEDFEKTLDLIKKYKAVEDSLQRAEYFVNVSHDALGIFEDSSEKKILQNLTGFSLNRSF